MKMIWLWFYFRFLTAIIFLAIAILSALAAVFSVFVPDRCLALLARFVSGCHGVLVSSEGEPDEEGKDRFLIEIKIAKWRKADRKRYFQSSN